MGGFPDRTETTAFLEMLLALWSELEFVWFPWRWCQALLNERSCCCSHLANLIDPLYIASTQPMNSAASSRVNADLGQGRRVSLSPELISATGMSISASGKARRWISR